MSKKSKKAERKKQKRQERIKQDNHTRRSLPMWARDMGDAPLDPTLGDELSSGLLDIESGLESDVDGDDLDFDYAGDDTPEMSDAEIAAALAAYNSPVTELFALGEPERFGRIAELDYCQKYGLDKSHAAALIQVLRDPVFMQVPSGQPAAYAPIHAWRALAQLGDPTSLSALFDLLCDIEAGDWDLEEIPQVICRFGAFALPESLRRHHELYDDPEIYEASLMGLQQTISEIAGNEPAVRDQAIERLCWVVDDRQPFTDTVRAHACEQLARLQATTCLPHIERAFADEVVDLVFIDLVEVRRLMSGG